MKILIADPDDEFVTLLTYWLHSHGHNTLTAQNRSDTLHLWREHAPELVLVDLALSEGMSRTDFCRQLRAAGRGNILVLTDPVQIDEEAEALEQGADGYLPKPLSMHRLQAHINALARRIQKRPGTPPASNLIKIGDTCVNLTLYKVLRNGRSYHLTPIEGRLLHFLLANVGQVIPLNTIFHRIWGQDGSAPYLIKTHIHHLRQKIEPYPQQPRFLLTIPTVGYLLQLQDRENATPGLGSAGTHVHGPLSQSGVYPGRKDDQRH